MPVKTSDGSAGGRRVSRGRRDCEGRCVVGWEYWVVACLCFEVTRYHPSYYSTNSLLHNPVSEAQFAKHKQLRRGAHVAYSAERANKREPSVSHE
jgi:hypothetical protein